MVDKQPTTRWCRSECGDTWSIHAVHYVCRVSCRRSDGRDHRHVLCFSALVCICPGGRTLRSKKFAITASIQAFLAGASAAVVGVIIVVSLELLPAALLDVPTIVIALIAFLVITALKVDVAKVALGAMTGGVLYAVAKGLWPSS